MSKLGGQTGGAFLLSKIVETEASDGKKSLKWSYDLSILFRISTERMLIQQVISVEDLLCDFINEGVVFYNTPHLNE